MPLLSSRIDRIIREKAHNRRKEFSIATGMDPASIHRILNNKSQTMHDRTAQQICAVYGVNREWLLYGTGEPYQADKTEAPASKRTDKKEDASPSNSALEKKLVDTIARMETWQQAFNTLSNRINVSFDKNTSVLDKSTRVLNSPHLRRLLNG